ncbi:class I SAM-dependent methyltransferase [Alteromonas gracilis]
MPTRPDFDAAWEQIAPVGGWLTRDQARVLFETVRDLPTGATVVEIGSHQGRSTLTLALARPDVRIVAIDPFVEGRKFGGVATRAVFEETVAGVRDRVRLLPTTSRRAYAAWDGPVDLVFVDGKHDALSTALDLRWARHLPPSGTVLVHDAFSSIGVTLALLGLLLPGRRLRYRGRTGSLARLQAGRPRPADRVAVVAELPWWLRNVGIKILLRLRLRGLAARFGHHDSWDPY